MEKALHNPKYIKQYESNEDMLATLQPNTHICVACDITLPTEFIKTQTVNDWKKNKVDLHKRPCIFIIHKF